MAGCRNGCARAAPIEAGEPAAPPPATFRPDYRAARLRGVGDMLRNVADAAPNWCSTRAPPAASPARCRSRGPACAAATSRAPPACPTPICCTPTDTFRPAAELRARFAQAGVDGARPVVTSCGSGVTACILTLGLRLAGLPEGAVYDGSWTEWGGRADTPVETKLSMADTHASAASAPGCRTPAAPASASHGFVNPPLLRGSTVLIPTVAERRRRCRRNAASAC